MAVKRFIVEVDFEPYPEDNNVTTEVISEAVVLFMVSMVNDGALEDFNGISVKEVEK